MGRGQKMTPEQRERLSKAAKEYFSTPEVKEKRSKIQKEAQNRPEVKERQIEVQKEVWAKPGAKERQSRIQRERWNTPGFRENHPNWKGGLSFQPYCPKFNNQLKEEIRATFNYKCFLCGSPQNGRRLCIHHVDYDKNDLCNGKKWPLIPLCQKCHPKTNHNRWYWFNLLMNYWAMNPEINLRIDRSHYPMSSY